MQKMNKIFAAIRFALNAFCRLCGAGLVIVTPSVALADYESVAFGVNDYDGTNACDDTDLQWSVDMAQGWRDKMINATTGPGYDYSRVWFNGDVDPEDFIDSYAAEETYPTGTDWADVVFFNGHAGSTCSSGPTSYTTLLTGDDLGVDCHVTLGTAMNEVEFGENAATSSDANMFIMHASNSLAWCVVEDGIIFEIDAGGTGTQFTMLGGFHNSPWNEASNKSEAEAYIGNSINSQLGENFIYTLALGQGDSNRECTSMVITSSSLTNANTLFFYGGFKDFKSTGTHTQHWYYSNCGDTCGDNDACA